MSQEEVESQLSAMYDGELPVAECELLSRRLARDEQLRARWSRYALIGAALRAEPVAAVHGDFARRVARAISQPEGARRAAFHRRRGWRSALLSSALVAGVAGIAVLVLRMDVVGHAPAPEEPQLIVVSAPRALPRDVASAEPASYTVPPASMGSAISVPTQLADYVVAHSEVSSPLTRRGLLSSLVGSETLIQAQPGER